MDNVKGIPISLVRLESDKNSSSLIYIYFIHIHIYVFLNLNLFHSGILGKNVILLLLLLFTNSIKYGSQTVGCRLLGLKTYKYQVLS